MAKLTIYNWQEIVRFTVINGNELGEYGTIENRDQLCYYYYQAFYLQLVST